MSARRLAPVPSTPSLFGTDRRRPRYRGRSALERSLRVLREIDALEPADGFAVAVLRSETDAFDLFVERHLLGVVELSPLSIAGLGREVVAQYNALRGNAPLLPPTGDDVDDLVAALSTPTGDGA